MQEITPQLILDKMERKERKRKRKAKEKGKVDDDDDDDDDGQKKREVQMFAFAEADIKEERKASPPFGRFVVSVHFSSPVLVRTMPVRCASSPEGRNSSLYIFYYHFLHLS